MEVFLKKTDLEFWKLVKNMGKASKDLSKATKVVCKEMGVHAQTAQASVKKRTGECILRLKSLWDRFVKRIITWLTENRGILEATLRGLIVGIVTNALRYVVKIGGRASNIVQIFDKRSISSLGNPRWFARVDRPHGNVPFHHINKNPKITGVPDPHIPISQGAAEAAGFLGKGLQFLNKIAFILAVIVAFYEIYQLGKLIQKDFRNGSWRNVVKRIVEMVINFLASCCGTSLGAVIGTAIFPGVGTMIGILLGGTSGGIISGIGCDLALDPVFDKLNFDVYIILCENCGKQFENRRYEDGKQNNCESCRK